MRLAFVFGVFLILTGDYSGLLSQLLGGSRNESGHDRNLRTSSRPVNTGYGDAKTKLDLDADIEDDAIKTIGSQTSKIQMLATIKNACLPKLICELNATPHKEKLTESEQSLLNLIRDTSMSTTAELTSKYHFAAHMGQLIAGVDGNGCHNFYPTCPFPGLQVLQMMKKVRMR